MRRRKFWGWGYEGDGLNSAELDALGRVLSDRLGFAGLHIADPPRLDDVRLPDGRVAPIASLHEILSADRWDRAEHAYGKAYVDLVRGLYGDYEHAPDLVAFPRNEQDVLALLEWCSDERIAVIPYGGGSSVVGGVEPDVADGYRGAVSVDLRRLSGVAEVDDSSRAARIAAGTLGPVIEEQLRDRGLTLRHFPQSFEMSTLGGWIATRAGGHYAMGRTRIDDFVESLRVVTPRGVLETRRFPSSGAGPSPERLFTGSEGTLGIITEAWIRLQARPRFRASSAITFRTFDEGVGATREIAQSGLEPANCRLLDPMEVRLSGSGDGSHALAMVGFESADHDPRHLLERALEICRSHGGRPGPEERSGGAPSRAEADRSWREFFLRGPHLRDAVVRLGLLTETLETAVTWDRFADLHRAVIGATSRAAAEVCGGGLVSCRLAYAYPDGAAPYYTVVAPARRGQEVEQWSAIKRAASEVLVARGATITHHHAVGRTHLPWYEQERPPLYAQALRAAKAALDPMSIMNPGVLLEARV